ncbi:glycosyltransferase family 1 protein [Chryseosolibacter indicus]|uniref:Glycosyltransferase family 1 protein n=1 Tax=Chryseosolibacter indicus TaxID=2782351 RepID=A0ABS5VM69_9BACT|nr:glycosyltransferase family 1 protein [Chryseosolibacter indicus]MBT1702553.1 glycosyltransferase family 1 protein [Chryseosolibacter indicus]
MPNTTSTDLVCFSHLRWNFVYQRPQHLMSRYAKNGRVFFVEEPIHDASGDSFLEVNNPIENIWVLVPHLAPGNSDDINVSQQRELFTKFFLEKEIVNYFFWYYTPMSLAFSDHFNPIIIIYDCMDELSAFKFAPHGLREKENELFGKADLVFTGGYSLYEAKKHKHPDVHAFPSSIDVPHFNKARTYSADPEDQASIPHPRIGFFGVLDERMDFDLVEAVAKRKPDWHFVMIGPVTKIDPNSLPNLTNIHYLGMKPYSELPDYISGWDVAMMPFAHNESTRYISPTKTPEYLAAGKPVVSTPIIDVIRQYGRHGLVNIAGTSEEFVRVVSLELENHDREEWLDNVDDLLSQNSWDKTWQKMMYLITRKLNEKQRMTSVKEQVYV